MLFPFAPWRSDVTRSCFLGPHDPFFAWVKAGHGHTPKWGVNAGVIPGQHGGVKPGQWVWDGDMQRAPIGALCMSP